MSLYAKTLRSTLWTALRIFMRQFVNSALFFWLAFVMEPAEVGVATLAVLVPMFFVPLVQRGMGAVIISEEAASAEVTDTAFVLNLALGFGLSVVLAVLAPVLAVAFHAPQSVGPLLVGAVIPLVVAFGSIHESLWARGFEHRKITQIYVITSLIGALGAVGAVLMGQGIWALVVFNVTTYLLGSASYWWVSPWRPAARFSAVRRGRMVPMMRFALPVMLSQTIAIGNQRVVEGIIGVMLSPAAVAVFRFGGNFIRLLNQSFVSPVIEVLLPMMARSTATAEQTLYRTLVPNAAVMFFVFLGFSTVAEDLTTLLFDPRWQMAGPVGAVLCYNVFASLIGPVANPMLTVRGKGHWSAALSTAALGVSVVFVVAGAMLGLRMGGQTMGALGAAIGFVARAILTIPMTLWVIRRALEVPMGRIWAAVWPFALLGFLMVAGLEFGLKPYLPQGWAGVALTVLAGSVAYLLGLRFGLRILAREAYDTLGLGLPARLRRYW